MSVVDPSNFAPSHTSDEVWDIVNTMPVTFQHFAEMGYYYARLYDVLTGANEGLAADTLTVNDCLRETLWRKLREVTTEAEIRIGYTLSTQYHYSEIDSGIRKRADAVAGSSRLWSQTFLGYSDRLRAVFDQRLRSHKRHRQRSNDAADCAGRFVDLRKPG